MKYIVAYVNACSESAKKLAAALGVRAIKADLLKKVPNDTTVFNYGYSSLIDCENIINSWVATRRCVNKVLTLSLLSNKNIPCLQFCTDKRKIPKSWEWIVVRTTVSGDNGKGIEYVERGHHVPKAPLYTEWYEHLYEYRIVVFKGKVVARYYKHLYEDGYWWFEEQPKKGLKQVSEACIQGALALGIDYVGFDVLYNSDEDFRICEANSGPIITDKVIKAIKKELK